MLSWYLFETNDPLPLRDKMLQIYTNLNTIKNNQNKQLTIDEITKKYQQIWGKYNDKHMKINSEILIYSILNSNKIQSLFRHKFRSYDILFNVNINNHPLTQTMNEIIDNNTITNAIIKTYNYLI